MNRTGIVVARIIRWRIADSLCHVSARKRSMAASFPLPNHFIHFSSRKLSGPNIVAGLVSSYQSKISLKANELDAIKSNQPKHSRARVSVRTVRANRITSFASANNGRQWAKARQIWERVQSGIVVLVTAIRQTKWLTMKPWRWCLPNGQTGARHSQKKRKRKKLNRKPID